MMKILILLFMAIVNLTPDATAVADGDAGFAKVNSFAPSHLLTPGEVAGALNKRFEDGRAWPRWNVNCQGWGRPGVNMVSGNWPSMPSFTVTVTGFVVGQRYRYVLGNAFYIATHGSSTSSTMAAEGIVVQANALVSQGLSPQKHGTFIATQTSYVLFCIVPALGGTAMGKAVTTEIVRVGNPRAFGRFNDVNGDDHLVLVTDEWRDFAGGDGGRGRAWRIRAGMEPIEIPLNGRDVFGVARLVSCFNGLALIRQDDERHYFQAAAVSAASDYIDLNCVPNWTAGDLVLFFAITGDTLADGTTDSAVDSYVLGINSNTQYYVKNIAGASAGKQRIELYSDAALSSKLDLGVAVGRFYLQRAASAPGYYGNGCAPLLMQPDGTGKTAFQVGFTAVVVNVVISGTVAATDVVTAPTHRLVPGDAFKATGVTGLTAGTTYFARPLSNDALQAYDTVDHALAGGATGLIDLTVDAQTGTLTKAGASGLAMPPAREGLYTANNRLVLINGKNNVAISDPLDPLHFTPFSATLTAALGEGDKVIGLAPGGLDSILFIKEGVVLSLNNFSQGPNGWTLTEVTREYGGLAALGIVRKGPDVWIYNRRGVDVVAQTMFGQPVPKGGAPVSRDMKRYLDEVLWTQSAGAVAATFNNKYLLAVPMKNSTEGNGGNKGRNSAILVYNDLTEGWDGLWQSSETNVFGFGRHKAFGEERLCFCNYDSEVCFFGMGFTDRGSALTDELETRMYAGEGLPESLKMRRKLWLSGLVAWDTFGPSLTVTAKAPGYNATQVLLQDKTYDPTKYLVAGKADYNPANSSTQFDSPWREDYSPTAGELTTGALDVHQNISEVVRMRVDAWGVALVISNGQGSARIQAVSVGGRMVAGNPSRMS